MVYDETEAKALEKQLLDNMETHRGIIRDAEGLFRVIHSLIDQTQADLDANGKKQYDDQGQIKRKPLFATDPQTLEKFNPARRNHVYDGIKAKIDALLGN